MTAQTARAKAGNLDNLEMWTVYDHPSDFPDVFVARRWIIGRGQMRATTDMRTDTNLERLRKEFIALGMVPVVRDPTDDPVILETWL